MKSTGSNRVLGLALGERSILAAEVWSRPGGRPEARRLAEFPLPEGASLAQPEALGQALGAFLREQRFSARAAVVGLAAKWVMVKPKDVPPADARTTADLLRLQAEREFPAELKDVVFDYAGGDAAPGDAAGPRRVLLMATPRQYVDGAAAMARAAKLNATALTPTSAALAGATRQGASPGRPHDDLVLYLVPAAAELSAQSGTAPSVLRHLRLEGPAVARPVADALRASSNGGNGGGNGTAHPREPGVMTHGFVGELRRAVALLPRRGTGGDRELIVWDGVGLDDDAVRALGEGTGLPVRSERLEALGVSAQEGEGAARYAGAVALALAGLREGSSFRLPVDFLHSRLAAPRKKSNRRPLAWAAVALAVVIGGVVLAYNDLAGDEKKLADLRAQTNLVAPRVKSAKEAVERITFAQHWFDGKPRFLAALADVTACFPDDSAIIATNLTLHDDFKLCQLIGKSINQQGPRALRDRLIHHPHFKEVKLLGMSDVGKEATFTIQFNYVADAP